MKVMISNDLGKARVGSGGCKGTRVSILATVPPYPHVTIHP